MAGSPADFHFATWRPRRERGLSSFLVSLCVHSAVVTAIWIINPHTSPREFRAPTITQILVDENRQITWYAPTTAMPAVAPAEEPTDSPAAETPRYEAPQPVQATAPDAESAQQLIVSDLPEIRFQQDQELPNMLSWQAPKVERPRDQLVAPRLEAPPRPEPVKPQPKPEPKVEPAANAGVDVKRFELIARLRDGAHETPQQRPLETEAPPEIAAAPAPAAVDPAQFKELSRLRFQQNEQKPQAPRQQTLDAEGAPVLRDSPGLPGLDASKFQELSRLRFQAGDRGRAQPEPTQRAVADVADAPAPAIEGLPSGASDVDAASLQELPRLRYQGSTQGAADGPAPSARAVGEAAGEPAPAVGGLEVAKLDLPGAAAPSLGAPAGEQSGGTDEPVNMIVAGVKPADRAPLELPRGSRSGAFSAGPNATPDGGRTASPDGTAARLRAPNLSIQGPPAGASEPGDAAVTLRRLTRSGGFEQLRPGDAPKIAPRAENAKIDPAAPFVGRPVYTLAINMPNVTSYRGDWVIQFAEAIPEDQRRQETEEERAARISKKDGSLTPPYPVIKVDPKYSAEAVREKVEGEVVLYCVIRETGEMTNLQLVEGLDPRLDGNARAAFEKWKFEPARKNGLPVAVETLVRIPFRVNPGIKVRY